MGRLLRALHPGRNPMARFLYAGLLILATFNPTGVSVGHWLWWNTENFVQIWPVYLIVLFALLGAHAFFWNGVRQAMSLPMLLGLLAFLGLLGYLPFFLQVMAPSPGAISWIVLAVLILHIGIASVYSTLRLHQFGQRVVQPVEGSHVTIDHVPDADPHHHS